MHQCLQCGENALKPRVYVDFTSLHERLRSQSGPASVHPDEVASILKNVELDLEDYQAEIHRLEIRVLLLAAQQEHLREYSAQTEALLSPIRKLPDELLCRIFDECCQMDELTAKEMPVKTAYSFRTAPAMAVSSVCARWRRNALSLPAIWSRISLSWKTPARNAYPEDKVEHQQRCFPSAIFLTRSLACPLTVELYVHGSPFLEDSHLHPIIAKLVQQTYRWQSYTFHSNAVTTNGLFLVPSSQFPLLEDLCLSSEEIYSAALEFFADKTPKLKKLNLHGFIETISFPHSHLTYFSGFLFKQHDLQAFLDMAPNLVSLALEETCQDQERPEARNCPRLETLDVLHSFGIDRQPVFPLLKCPSLKTLRFIICYSAHNKADWSNFDSCMGFVQRSSFPLTTLEIASLPLSDADLVYLLVHVPTLMKLTVDDIDGLEWENISPITEKFIDSLHAHRTCSLRSNIRPIVPRLRSLTVVTAAEDFQDMSVVDMVRSRWIPMTVLNSSSLASAVGIPALQVDCLREFTLKFQKRTKVESAVYAPLEDLEKRGMRVVVAWKT